MRQLVPSFSFLTEVAVLLLRRVDVPDYERTALRDMLRACSNACSAGSKRLILVEPVVEFASKRYVLRVEPYED